MDKQIHSVDLKKLLFCRDLSDSINNFEFSLKNFHDDVTVNSAINVLVDCLSFTKNKVDHRYALRCALKTNMYIFGPFSCEFQIKEQFKLTTESDQESLWKLSGPEIIWNQLEEFIISDYFTMNGPPFTAS